MSVQAIALSLKTHGLKPSEKLLLLALANYADDAMKCWPSHKTLASDTGLTQRTILTTFKRLEAANLLVRTPRDRADGSRASDIITLTLGGEIVSPRGEMVAPPVGKSFQGGGEMVSPLTTFEPSKEPKKAEDADLADAVWNEANQDSRNRSGKPATRRAVAAALAKGATPQSLLASVKAHCRRSGEHAKGTHRIIEAELWREAIPAKPPPSQAVDPAYRLHCERHYAATGEWKPEWGEKPRKAA